MFKVGSETLGSPEDKAWPSLLDKEIIRFAVDNSPVKRLPAPPFALVEITCQKQQGDAFPRVHCGPAMGRMKLLIKANGKPRILRIFPAYHDASFVREGTV
jgi:hypothetical protein